MTLQEMHNLMVDLDLLVKEKKFRLLRMCLTSEANSILEQIEFGGLPDDFDFEPALTTLRYLAKAAREMYPDELKKSWDYLLGVLFATLRRVKGEKSMRSSLKGLIPKEL